MSNATNWPDLSIDAQAWNQAKAEMPTETDYSKIALRAQVIKSELSKGKQ